MPAVNESNSGNRLERRWKLWVEEGRYRLCPRVIIGALPDDTLLEIFDFYLVRPYWELKREDAWHTLVHVCKRWRSIVFASPHRLRLRLLCTYIRPMQNTLDFWPALPIVIRGRRGMLRSQAANNIIAALKHHDRVCDINIDDIPNTLLKKIRAIDMKDPFPALTSLWLSHASKNIIVPPLPDSFLGGSAPRLRTLSLDGIPSPSLPKLLLSTRGLVELRLWDIPLSGYISPEVMVTCLSVLTKLQNLVLEFRCPRSPVDRDNRLLPRLTRIVLSALTYFRFKGDSEYMEDIVCQIDTPLLDNLHITFFNQLIFDTPLLRDFIGHIKTFKTPRRANIAISDDDIKVWLFGPDGNNDDHTLLSGILCRPLDWQLSSLAQVFNSALSHLLTFEHLEINDFRQHWQDDTENAQWLEILHSFPSVKNLVLYVNLIELVAPALGDLVGERVTEMLPTLQNLFVESRQPSGPVKKAIGKFISARRLSDRPVSLHYREYSYQDYVLWEAGDR